MITFQNRGPLEKTWSFFLLLHYFALLLLLFLLCSDIKSHSFMIILENLSGPGVPRGFCTVSSVECVLCMQRVLSMHASPAMLQRFCTACRSRPQAPPQSRPCSHRSVFESWRRCRPACLALWQTRWACSGQACASPASNSGNSVPCQY
jgi:hypothetical protein